MLLDLVLEDWRERALDAAAWAPVAASLLVLAWLFLKRILMAAAAAGVLWLSWPLALRVFKNEPPAVSLAFAASVAFLAGFLASGDKRAFSKRFLLSPYLLARRAAAGSGKKKRKGRR